MNNIFTCNFDENLQPSLQAYAATAKSHRERLIDFLIEIVWNGIYVGKKLEKLESADQRPGVENNFQNAFFNRIKGFLAELIFFDLTHNDPKISRGGWFVPKPKVENPLENSLYYSVNASLSGLEPVYKALSDALPLIPLYVVVPKTPTDWYQTLDERFDYWKYDPKSGNFITTSTICFYQFWDEKSWPQATLTDLYSSTNDKVVQEAKLLLMGTDYSDLAMEMLVYDRYVFDELIASRHYKGRPTDLDFIELRLDNRIHLIDVKDKYLSKEGKLGINKDHLPFFVDIDRHLGTDSQYIVRVSKGGLDRTLNGWYCTAIRNFSTGCDREGKQGLNGQMATKTSMLPLSDFQPWKVSDGISTEVAAAS